MACTQLVPCYSAVQLLLNQIHVFFWYNFSMWLWAICWCSRTLNAVWRCRVIPHTLAYSSATLGCDRLSACTKLFENTGLAFIWATRKWWKGVGKKRLFLGQPIILHPLLAKEKAYYPWENNMAYLNCKGIELKTSPCVILAGEDKDIMKIRKGGKKWLSLKKSSAFPAWFHLQ